jgi:membrane protease YdiL (CAAX protease family)
MARLVVLSEYHDIVAASMDQEKLRSSGIKCHVTDDLTQIGLSNTIGGARLMVEEDDAEAAAAVLMAHKDAAPVFEDDETEEEVKKTRTKHIFIAQSVFFTIAYLFLGFLTVLIGQLIWRNTSILSEGWLFYTSFTSLVVASILLLFTLIYKKHSFSAYFSFIKFRASIFIPIVVIISGLFLFESSLIGEYIGRDYHSNMIDFHRMFQYNYPDLLIVSLFFIIVAPICEELIFRGFILKKMLSKYGPVFSIVFSAILYAFIFVNAAGMIEAFALGLFLGIIFYISKSVLPGIIAHFLFNLLAVLQYPIMELFGIYKTNIVDLAGANFSLMGGIGVILLILGILLLYIEKVKKNAG